MDSGEPGDPGRGQDNNPDHELNTADGWADYCRAARELAEFQRADAERHHAAADLDAAARAEHYRLIADLAKRAQRNR